MFVNFVGLVTCII